jgi:hypothetical protein
VAGSTNDYLRPLVPGLMVQNVLLASMVAGVALNVDVTRNVLDRFRSMPIARTICFRQVLGRAKPRSGNSAVGWAPRGSPHSPAVSTRVAKNRIRNGVAITFLPVGVDGDERRGLQKLKGRREHVFAIIWRILVERMLERIVLAVV